MAVAKKKAGSQPGFEVQWMSPGDIIPYDNNPRVLSEEAIEKVAKSIEKFGWQQAIVVDQHMVIIVGHTRLQAAKKLKLKVVPVKVALDLSDEDARAYRIADNRVAEETTWDRDLLMDELHDLSEMEFELADLGFDAGDVDRLFDGAFAPMLDPSREGNDVTDGDVNNAKSKLAENPKRLADQDIIEVTCPHCGDTYGLDRKAII